MSDKFSGFVPRHISKIEEVFCNAGCLLVDQILVPFPDCLSHGGASYHNNHVLFIKKKAEFDTA